MLKSCLVCPESKCIRVRDVNFNHSTYNWLIYRTYCEWINNTLISLQMRIYVRIHSSTCSSCAAFTFRTRLAVVVTRVDQQRWVGKFNIRLDTVLPASSVRFGRRSLIKSLCSQTQVQLVQWHTLHLYLPMSLLNVAMDDMWMGLCSPL